MTYDPRELLARSAELIGERGAEYGNVENNFQLIADMSTLRLGRTIHPYEVATILCEVKSARLFANPTHIDSRLDKANYEMFAAMFAEDYARFASNEVNWKTRDGLHKAEMVMPPRAEPLAAALDQLELLDAGAKTPVTNTPRASDKSGSRERK